MKSGGQTNHGLSEQAREQGNFVEALKFSDEALVGYAEANDWFGFCDILSSRVLTLRHLFEKTGKREYLVVAKHTAMAAVEIAENSGDPSIAMMPYSKMGRVQHDLGELRDSAASYEKAVNLMIQNPPKEHNRPSVLADLKIHMEVVKYKTGDKDALSRLETALTELEAADEEKYNKDTWMSGAHMRMAEILKSDNPQKAKEHLSKAKQIIDANPELKLRSEQWEKLAKSLS